MPGDGAGYRFYLVSDFSRVTVDVLANALNRAFFTELTVCENILTCVRELTGRPRKKGCVICGTGIFLLSLTTAPGFSVIPFHPFGPDSVFLDFRDFIVSTNLLPLGVLILSIYCVYGTIGWAGRTSLRKPIPGKALRYRHG